MNKKINLLLSSKKKTVLPKKVSIQEKIENLLKALNHPDTNCSFWKGEEQGFDIIGIRPIIKTITSVVNKDGFTPLTIQKDEMFTRFYVINLCSEKAYKDLPNDLKNTIEELKKKGISFIVHHDIMYIQEHIKNDR